VGVSPALKLDARQAAQLVGLGEQFLAATDQTPTAPASSATKNTSGDVASDSWISAQEANDEKFRVFFGYAAFNAQQILRYQQQHPAPQAGR
jgi:hypothetical protein